ncbi:hypothetical protein [Flavobacterium wongokense]|uniref:hypothetical protein n=1 Tax=Flavobacterium wongokense TaxID=2910674 RepID=UPI001F175109|nr:hypothetical protein [Flavobacterium sp. WG47]MCF6132894.1 hypothetical protein [Flavobacterium sp. WG47]
MDNHLELTDWEFEQQFADCKIPPALFSHEAHLRLAWIHIDNYGIDAAVANVCSQLKSFVEFLGVSDKYNETVTIAAVRAVYHFKLKSGTDNFQDFIAENQRLTTSFKELLNQHYTTDIFNSAKAKRRFIKPDLLPFD